MKKFTKILAGALACATMIGATIGGTVAWLTAKTPEVTNTFTYGDIDLTLTETEQGPFTVIPGVDITKDPVVTIKTPEGAKDVESYVFVKVDEVNWGSKLTYAIDAGWTQVLGETNVWYKVVTPTAEGITINVLKDKKVTVSSELTKKEIKEITGQGKTTLTFTAYAIQKSSGNDTEFTPEQAWAEVKPADKPIE